MKKAAFALLFFVLALVPAFAQTNYGKFTVTTPTTLTAGAPEKGTTNSGSSYTSVTYSTQLANSDLYAVMTAEYPFAVQRDDLDRAIAVFAKQLNATILKQATITLTSGEPAIVASIRELDANGRDLRIAYVVSYKGNTAYQFMFASYADVTTTDMAALHTFLSTLRIN